MLDEAVEEKDGGEKVRLGMVVCSFSSLNVGTMLISIGYSRELGSDARGAGAYWWRTRTAASRLEDCLAYIGFGVERHHGYEIPN